MIELSHDEHKRRAKNIRLVLSDNDGVMTDNGVYYSDRGEAFKRYSIRDGMAVERLLAAGILTGIITGETSPSLVRRAEKLGVEHLYLGIKDKREKFDEILLETGLRADEVAYIGDDVNDVEIMRHISDFGLTACPGDATDFVRPVVHYICRAPGGNGAFREYAEMLLALKSSAKA